MFFWDMPLNFLTVEGYSHPMQSHDEGHSHPLQCQVKVKAVLSTVVDLSGGHEGLHTPYG